MQLQQNYTRNRKRQKITKEADNMQQENINDLPTLEIKKNKETFKKHQLQENVLQGPAAKIIQARAKDGVFFLYQACPP